MVIVPDWLRAPLTAVDPGRDDGVVPLPTDPARRHVAVADRFGEVVGGVRDWDAPTPVPEWRARDVVGHLLAWLPGFVAGGSAHRLPAADADTDPVRAWTERTAAVRALLEDPTVAGSAFTHDRLPPQSLAEAITTFYVSDVLLHTWDLARATGQDDRLDEETCVAMLAGMEPMADVLAASGQYGPRVPVPDDASAQDRLLGLIGRDPAWRP